MKTFIDICHQVLDLYSQPQPSRTDSPQGPNSAPTVPKIPAASAPTTSVTGSGAILPTATPTKTANARGFDQRLDAMQPKVEVGSASAGYVNYAMASSMAVQVGVPVPVGVPPNMAVPGVPPPSLPSVAHAYQYAGYPPMLPTGAPPVPPNPPQPYAPPPPPSQPAPPFYPYSGYPKQVYPPPPTPAGPQPPPPRPY